MKEIEHHGNVSHLKFFKIFKKHFSPGPEVPKQPKCGAANGQVLLPELAQLREGHRAGQQGRAGGGGAGGDRAAGGLGQTPLGPVLVHLRSLQPAPSPHTQGKKQTVLSRI